MREVVEAVLAALVFATFARLFVVQVFEVQSSSMAPGLEVGDHLLVNKFIHGPVAFHWERSLLPMRTPRHADVVLFRGDGPGGERLDYVKRVIATPGNRIEIVDKRVRRDGILLEEFAYVRHTDLHFYPSSLLLDESMRSRDNLGARVLARDEYFVLGDDRDASRDSRSFGAILEADIRGRVVLRFRPSLVDPQASPAPGRWRWAR